MNKIDIFDRYRGVLVLYIYIYIYTSGYVRQNDGETNDYNCVFVKRERNKR